MHIPALDQTEDRSARTKSPLYVVLLAVIAAIFGFLFGFDTAVINGVLSVASFVYVWYYIPETRGRTLEEIQELLER